MNLNDVFRCGILCACSFGQNFPLGRTRLSGHQQGLQNVGWGRKCSASAELDFLGRVAVLAAGSAGFVSPALAGSVAVWFQTVASTKAQCNRDKYYRCLRMILSCEVEVPRKRGEERDTRFELATSTLARLHSTELVPLSEGRI